MTSVPVALLLALALAPAEAGEPDPEVVDAIRLLERAHLGTDGPALLAYLRAQTPSPSDQGRLTDAVRRLGDDTFEVRERASQELLAAGRLALPFLRKALQDPDIEIMWRARSCLERINSPGLTPQLTAAARLLAARRPAGAAAALLAFLPYAEEEEIEEAIFAALRVVGIQGQEPHPAILGAVTDARPLRRAAAAHVLAACTRAAARPPLTRLLKDDDPRVRYEAAVGLLRQGDRSASRVLIALLTEAPTPLTYRVEDTLWGLAGDKAPANLSSANTADRQRGRTVWEAWWKDQGDQADLNALNDATPVLGLTLVCEYDGVEGGGRLAEYGRDGKIRWQINNLSGINDAQLLPGGRVLVAERNAGQVTERDRTGRILWHHNAPGAIACQRLPGGNTLIATFNELIEVTPDQQRVHTLPGSFRHAIRLRNGHILAVTSPGQILELDADWTQLRSVTPTAYGNGAGYWASVELLPSGRLLVAYGGSGKVVELDPSTGTVVWECSLPNCVFATRLRNGHTLIAGFEQRTLVEVDREGKELTKIPLQGRPFTIRRY
jgi:hypothetical protein